MIPNLIPAPDPIELTPPDLTPYRQGNTGIEYVHQFDSGQRGPHVMISALVHGNELCGAIALHELLQQIGQGQVRPLRGRLTLAFVNVAAYHQFNPATPRASRYVDEDFNRLWSATVLESDRTSCELQRARELRPLVDTVDLLLDLHSMHHTAQPLIMAGALPKGRQFAREVGWPFMIVADAGHQAGVRLRDYGGFGHADSPKNALLVECGQHWQADSAVVARAITARFLQLLALVDPEWAIAQTAALPQRPPQMVEVTTPITVKTPHFRFAKPYRGLEVIPQAGTIIAYDSDRPIVTPYDNCVLVMPSFYLQPGSTAVRLGRSL